MATVQITVPDALVPRLLAAATATFPQYAEMTPTNLFKQVTADYWRTVLSGYEEQQAMQATGLTLAGSAQAARVKAGADAATVG